ncbi:hypothetical protein, partial [Antrihabitans spumae]
PNPKQIKPARQPGERSGLAGALAGVTLPYERDLYDIPVANLTRGESAELRDVIKIVVAAGLSADASSRDAMVHAVSTKILELPSVPATISLHSPRRPEELYRFTTRLVDSVVAAYPWIKPLFFTDLGVKLQRVDSDLMHTISIRVLRQTGFSLYPVHDSVLVPESLKAKVCTIMTKVAEEHGYSIPLRVYPPLKSGSAPTLLDRQENREEPL